MLKPSLQLRIGQQLTMTPQLQQAIRLLQLPSLDLQAHVRETLETNVMLEAEDELALDAPPDTVREREQIKSWFVGKGGDFKSVCLYCGVHADIIHKADSIGTIEKGKFADIIAVAGDPLTDITEMQRVKFVMKGGAVVRNDLAAGAMMSSK